MTQLHIWWENKWCDQQDDEAKDTHCAWFRRVLWHPCYSYSCVMDTCYTSCSWRLVSSHCPCYACNVHCFCYACKGHCLCHRRVTQLLSQTCYTACVMNVLHCSCDRRVMLLAPCYALLCDAPELVDHAIASCPLVDHKTQQKIQKQIRKHHTLKISSCSEVESPSPQINQVPHIAIVSCTGACGDLVIGNQPIGDQEFVRLLWCFVLKSFR